MTQEQFTKTFWTRDRKYFEAAAETWYQRTHSLGELSKIRRQPVKRRQKARRLWEEMLERMVPVIQFSTILNTPKIPLGFKIGSISSAPLIEPQ